MRQRFQRIKESTVRILVGGRAAGTGFAVAPNLIATNFHVVQQISAAPNNQTQVAVASTIEVELQGGRKLSAAPHPSILGKNLQEAIGKDIAILTVPGANLRPLALGRFADIEDGDGLYLAGFPLGVEQPIVTTGRLSTKWKTPGYMGQGGSRDVAWLDVSMTKGNSGGPVVRVSDNPDHDAVIGIANFSLNPFAQTAEELAGIAAAFPGNVAIMGVDFKKFAVVVGSALASQSHGVGGCVAVDYLKLLRHDVAKHLSGLR
jgi:S1-C subfamily serine protease